MMSTVAAGNLSSACFGAGPIVAAASNTPSAQPKAALSDADIIAITGGLLATGGLATLIGVGVHSVIYKNASPRVQGNNSMLRGGLQKNRSGDVKPDESRIGGIDVSKSDGPLLLHHAASETHFYHEQQTGALCCKHSLNALLKAFGAEPMTVPHYAKLLAEVRAGFPDSVVKNKDNFTSPHEAIGVYNSLRKELGNAQQLPEIQDPPYLSENLKHDEHEKTNMDVHIANNVARLNAKGVLTCYGHLKSDVTPTDNSSVEGPTSGKKSSSGDYRGHWAAILPRADGTWAIVDSTVANSQDAKHPSIRHAHEALLRGEGTHGQAYSRATLIFH